MPEREDIFNYMMRELEYYRDSITDEINMTYLAEDAWQHFNVNGVDIPEIYFEVAYEISEIAEQQKGR